MGKATIQPPEGIEAEEARLYLAIKLYEAKRLSLGQAAEYAGYSVRAFIEILGNHGIPVIRHDPDELSQDATNA